MPLLLGLIFLDTAVLMGKPGAGGYPAVFAFFLALVGLITRRLEARFRTGLAAPDKTLLHPVHRPALAGLSTLFFFFGVITLWPWLGKLYGAGYLWVLILGVLAPLLYLWGRLKQPHTESPLPALTRFNRLLPYHRAGHAGRDPDWIAAFLSDSRWCRLRPAAANCWRAPACPSTSSRREPQSTGR